jgi:mono/diheme cytochrome c family protein
MNARLSTSIRLGTAAILLAALNAAAGCQLFEPPVADVISEPPPPPPISGGTLLVTSDRSLAIAADSEGDRVFIIDLATTQVRNEIALNAGDEPGRVIEGPEGTAYVALRSGGAIAAINIETGSVERRAACQAPRGIAYDAAKSEIHVACAGGELVTLPEEPGAAPSRVVKLDRDLRDVVVQGGKLLVSRFRAADILVVGADGEATARLWPGSYISPNNRYFEPAVAWRMIPVSGGVAMVHQRAFAEDLPTGASPTGNTYYGGACDNSIVHSAVTVFDAEAEVQLTVDGMGAIGNVTLPVDIAASADGRIAVVGAGAGFVVETTLGTVKSEDAFVGCTPFAPTAKRMFNVSNPIAVAYGSDGRLLVQGRDTLLYVIDLDGQTVGQIPLPGAPRLHTGHQMFHMAAAGASSPIACASCHPEGHTDGRVWRFEKIGERRTQTMLGGVLDTAPLHWDGDLDGLDALMGEVFVKRMGGAAPVETSVSALADWMQSLPVRKVGAPKDTEEVARGEALFNDPKVACASCHAGPSMTNDQTVDVGTGKAFQVPSLVSIGDRAPFMHDGCAATLHERFDPTCGGGDSHGRTSHLTPAQIDDLVAYLETL